MKKIMCGCIIILVFTTYVYNAPIGWRNDVNIGTTMHSAGRLINNIAISNEVIHVVSHAGTPVDCDFPYYTHSANNGITWTHIPINNWNNAPMYSQSVIVANGNVIIALFAPLRQGIQEVISFNGGLSWSDTFSISKGSHPSIIKAHDAYYTFWHDRISESPEIDELYFKKSQDGDNWWSYNPESGRPDSAQRITITNGKSNFPSVASGIVIENGQEHQFMLLVWAKVQYDPPRDYEIYYNFSVNGEEWTYGTDGNRITNTDEPSLYPAVACYSQNLSVHCVWQEGEGDGAQIWYIRSMNNGQTWNEPIQLAVGEHPDIAVDHQGVHIVFSSHWDSPSAPSQYIDSEIYYITSTDYGNSWKSITRLTDASENSEHPKITADLQGRHIIFADWRQANPPQNPQLWYKQNDILSPSAPTDFKIEYIACNGGVSLHFIWDENPEPDIAGYNIYRSTNGWVYYKINAELITTNRYQDNINYGESYYYYVVAIDQAANQSLRSNVITFGSPDYKFDIGKPIPSLYVVERDTYIIWDEHNSAKTVDMDNIRLAYHFDGLNPNVNYEMAVVYYQGDSVIRFQSLKVDGVELQEIEVPVSPEMYTFVLSPASYTDGQIYVEIEKLLGPNAVISEIYIWESDAGTGSQSSGESEINRFRFTIKPNILRNTTTISYEIPVQTKVCLRIYNSSGRLIRILVDGVRKPGQHRHTWDGKDQHGITIAQGIYFMKLTVDNQIITKRLSVVR